MSFKGDVPVSGESIFVSKGGDDSLSGLTAELPLLTVGQGITNAISTGATNVDLGDGNYDESIIVPDNTDIRGFGAGITSTTASTTTVTAGGSAVVEVGFLGAQATDTIAYLVDGKARAQLVARTMILGSFGGPVSDNVVGIQIQGTNDDIPVNLINGECRATNSTYVNLLGDTDTPPSLTLGTITNFEDGFTLVKHNPINPFQITDVIVSFTNDTVAAATGVVLFTGNSGTLNVITSQLNALGQQIATVGNGLRFGITGPAVAGNLTVESGGVCNLTGIGIWIGNITVETGGVLNASITDLVGDITVDVGGTLNCAIAVHAGTVIRNGTINGSINDGGLTKFYGGIRVIKNPGNSVNLDVPDTVTADYNIILPPANGIAGQVLELDSSLELQFVDVTASPGGLTTEVQFNNAGVLDGISGITSDGTNLDVSGRIDGAGTGGLLLLRAGANSPTGGAVQLEGGGASTTGGKVSLFGGLGGANGGNIELFAGDGPTNTSGNVILKGGSGDDTGVGGDILLTGGNAGFDSGKGGDIVILSGNAEGSGEDSGAITIDAGTTLAGNVGDILLARATGSVGVGVSTVVPSAQLEVSSASRGFLMPRMTTAERDNISSPATGLEIFNITTNAPEYFDGAAWAGTAGNETLAQTLANGNTSGGTNLIMSSGDSLQADTLTYNNSPSVTDQIDVLVRIGQVGHLDQATASGTFVPATQPAGPVLSIAMAWDGSKLFMGNNAATIRGFDLSIPWDITSSSDVVDSFAPGFSVQGAVFSPDGLTLIVNQGAGIVRQANLSTSWNLTTAVTFASVTPTEPLNDVTDISISPDGHNLYLFVGTGGIIHQYFLSEPFQVLSIGSEVAQKAIGISGNVFSGDFSNDGRILFAHASGNNINEFALGIGWDITSIGPSIKSFNVGNNDTRGIVIKPDSTKFYTTTFPDTADNEDANQFDLGLITTAILIGAAKDLAITHNGTEGFLTNFTGDLTLDNFSGTSSIIARIGSTSSTTNFVIKDSSDSALLLVDGSGDMFVASITGTDTGGLLDLKGADGVGATDEGGAVDITAGVGGATSGLGGALNFNAGAGGGSGIGGAVTVAAGDSTNFGGAMNIRSGGNAIQGGEIDITAGTGTTTGGEIDINAGAGVGTGSGGLLKLDAGSGGLTSGDGGSVAIVSGMGRGGNANSGSILIEAGTPDGSGSFGTLDLQQEGGFVGIGTLFGPDTLLQMVGADPTFKIQADADLQTSAIELLGSQDAGGAPVADIKAFNFRSGSPVEVASVDFIPASVGTSSGEIVLNTKEQSGSLTERVRIDDEGKVAIGSQPIASALLNVASVTKGFMQPRLTEIQRDAIASPANGLSIHNTDIRRPEFFDDNTWNTSSVVAPTTVEVLTAADIDDLATAGVITIATGENLTFDLKADLIFSATEFVLEGTAELRFLSSNADAAYGYGGTGSFISGVSTRVSIENVVFFSTSSGTFLSLLLPPAGGGTINIVNSAIIGFASLGSVIGGNIVWRFSAFIGNALGVDAVDCTVASINSSYETTPLTGTLFDISGDSVFGHQLALNVVTLESGTSFLRLDPALAQTSPGQVNGNAVIGDTLFDTSGGTTGTFTVVADAAIGPQSIDSVSDLGGLASFNFTPGPTVFDGQEVTLSGYVTNTAYNGTFIITQSGAGVFAVNVPFGTDEATGSFSGDSITLTDTATTLANGDTLVIETDGATNYDGGATVYNKLTNSFQVNRTFTTTHTGSWDTAGIDQTDPRVLASNNPGFKNSKAIAFSDVNGNVVTTNVQLNAYVPLQSPIMIQRPSTERFKQVNNIGIWEYIGNEPFEGLFTATVNAIKTGATANYRFALAINQITPTFATEPYTPMEVKTTKVSIPMLAALSMVKGDQVQIVVAGDGTSDDITPTDVLVSIQ